MTPHPIRPVPMLLTLALAVAACSDPAPTATPEVAPSTTEAAADVDADAAAPADVAAPDPADAPDAADAVRLSVDVGGSVVEFDIAASPELEPFGRFATCSGWRALVGAYSVVVAEPDHDDVVSVGAITNEAVTGSGTYDADVRVERADGSSLSAMGTMRLDDGLRAGEIVAFGPDGTRVTATFECPSPRPAPEAVESAPAVEVVVLVRQDDAERILGLVAAADLAECGPDEAGSSTAVRIDGDDRLGAVTTFELTAGEAPTLQFRAGATSFEFEAVEVTLGDDGRSGTFSASDADMAVDGAFRCG